MKIQFKAKSSIFEVYANQNLMTIPETRLRAFGGIVGDRTSSLIRVLKQNPNIWINFTLEDEV